MFKKIECDNDFDELQLFINRNALPLHYSHMPGVAPLQSTSCIVLITTKWTIPQITASIQHIIVYDHDTGQLKVNPGPVSIERLNHKGEF